MKKLVLAVSIISILSLVGCNQTKPEPQPEPEPEPEPEPTIDPHMVSEEEYFNALSFKNTQYLQVEQKMKTQCETSNIYRLSPEISYGLHIFTATTESTYLEIFSKKLEDDKYDIRARQANSDEFERTISDDPDSFITPQSDTINLYKQFSEEYNVSYSDFSYDSNTHEYSASVKSPSVKTYNLTLKFNDKKIQEARVLTINEKGKTDAVKSFNYEYNEEAPQLPPIYKILDADEYYNALTFKNIQYLQRSDYITDGEGTRTQSFEYSPTVFHSTKENPLRSYYYEKYVIKEQDNLFKILERNNPKSEFNERTSYNPDDFSTPQSDENNIFIILKAEFKAEFKDFDYIDNSHRYKAYTTEELVSNDISLNFLNIQITNVDINVLEDGAFREHYVTSYSYDNITPDPYKSF